MRCIDYNSQKSDQAALIISLTKTNVVLLDLYNYTKWKCNKCQFLILNDTMAENYIQKSNKDYFLNCIWWSLRSGVIKSLRKFDGLYWICSHSDPDDHLIVLKELFLNNRVFSDIFSISIVNCNSVVSFLIRLFLNRHYSILRKYHEMTIFS